MVGELMEIKQALKSSTISKSLISYLSFLLYAKYHIIKIKNGFITVFKNITS